MQWKCDECGFAANPSGNRECEACGFVKFGQLLLISQETGRCISMAVDTLIGKQLLKSFAGNDAAYASEPQFKIYRDSGLGGWAIQPSSTAKNPTYIDGVPLTEVAVRLNEGTVITLGPERLKLTSRIEA